MVHNATTYFSWEFPEFTFYEKKTDWYWWVGAITIAGVLLCVFLWKNNIFALFIFITGILFILSAQRRPRIDSIEISELGIKTGGHFHPYSELTSFWIIEETDTEPAKLLLYSPKVLVPLSAIDIDVEVDPLELRDFLSDYIDEQELKESRIHKLIERYGP